MSNDFNKQRVFPLKLDILTPVSIGGGESLDALYYTVHRSAQGKKYLHYVNLEKWVADQPRDELTRVLDEADHAELKQMIDKSFDPEKHSLGRMKLEARLGEKGKKNEARSQYIETALKNPLNNRLIIPGSSVKGAIRTAVLDCLDQKFGVTGQVYAEAKDKNLAKWELARLQNDANKALSDLLGEINDNSFQDLKIFDFECGDDEGMVAEAIEIRKVPPRNYRDKSKGNTPKNTRETTFSQITLGRPYHLFSRLILGMNSAREPKLIIRPRRGKYEEFDLKRLFVTVSEFYKERFLREYEDFYSQPHLAEVRKYLQGVRQRVSELKPEKEMLLRLGHYSHIECVTVSNNHPEGPVTGSTRTLVGGKYPFGWVIISVAEKEKPKAPEKPPALWKQLVKTASSLNDWGQLKQFNDNHLSNLPPEEYNPALGDALRKKLSQIKISKIKLKKNPNLPKELENELENWLRRFL